MAVTLTITNDELGGDIALTTSPRGVLNYAFATPAPEAESVSETITVWFDSGLDAALSTGTGILRRLGAYFVDARRRAELGTGDRIWLKFDKDDGDGVWRSEILDGRLVYAPETLGGAFLPSDKGEVAVAITRRAYWEKDTEYEMPLSIGGSYATGGRDIWNHDDGDAMNWVAWEAQAVVGDLPAPMRVELTNTYVSAQEIQRLLMAVTHNTDDVGDFDANWVLEGEGNTYNPGTVVASATSSNDFYITEQWTSTTWTQIAAWAFPNVTFARGNPFRAVMRSILSGYDDLYARLRIHGGSGDGEIWRSRTVKVGYSFSAMDELTDFGTVPPEVIGSIAGTSGAFNVYLDVLRNEAGTHSFSIDHITFMPMDGGFRVVQSTSDVNGLGTDDTLKDDGIDRITYRETSGGDVGRQFATLGEYLTIQPQRGGRLTLLWQLGNKTALATITATVRLYYRPRRLSL